MPAVETNILESVTKECEGIFERMRRDCEDALEIIRDMDLGDLSAESREQLHDRIHTLREIVRMLSCDFEDKLKAETEKLGRGLSLAEARCLLYGRAER
jgi:hypothetical protein